MLLTVAAHMDLRSANSITKTVNLATNITALTVYWTNGMVLAPLGLAVGLSSMARNWLGARFFDDKGACAVKPIMLVVLEVFFVRVLLEQRSSSACCPSLQCGPLSHNIQQCRSSLHFEQSRLPYSRMNNL